MEYIQSFIYNISILKYYFILHKTLLERNPKVALRFSMRLVLFQPEIPQNVGTLIRFAACMGLPLDIIEPCGFLFTDKHFKRSSMDYQNFASVHRFVSWKAFCHGRQDMRRVGITTKSPQPYLKFSFESSDLLILGQESCGFPSCVVEDFHETVAIPMMPKTRSLNLAIAGAIVASEALRQTHQFPEGIHGK